MTKFLTTDDAAKILGINPTSVSKAINRGKLKATKFGIQWMLELDEVMRYKVEFSRKSKP